VAAAHPPADLSWGEKLPALILVAALLFIGIWPRSLSTGIDAALALSPPPAAAAAP
jgi:NADH-quinone oxidoreductase subunit M